MEKICENINKINNIYIVIKYIIPILLVIIGFLKLVMITNTKKAIKKFIIYIKTFNIKN